jgi:hypothetical protein
MSSTTPHGDIEDPGVLMSLALLAILICAAALLTD